ncbi:MAG: energy-coupling factor ABC transporter permease [Geminicoccaceae bacterium]|nr:energy-coupling factor ABC transporter permease [Geminicoccaceae bacterium]HRY23861.1 energy-coupling factor ABC transporter permease [Geminicoccaceae bacterium]
MHMEPGVVTGAQSLLGVATATGALGYAGRRALEALRIENPAALALRSVIATGLVLTFFEVLPHHPVGVSEVHLILGSTLFLLFGLVPTAIGLALGLLTQGLLFAPFDLPQYGMNVTTLLVPLFAVAALARRIIPAGTPYVDLGYGDVLKLSVTYQGGICTWVAFWSLYGGGFGAANLQAVGVFFAAYMLVVLLEPLVDLAVLALAKAGRNTAGGPLFHRRLLQGAG